MGGGGGGGWGKHKLEVEKCLGRPIVSELWKYMLRQVLIFLKCEEGPRGTIFGGMGGKFFMIWLASFVTSNKITWQPFNFCHVKWMWEQSGMTLGSVTALQKQSHLHLAPISLETLLLCRPWCLNLFSSWPSFSLLTILEDTCVAIPRNWQVAKFGQSKMLNTAFVMWIHLGKYDT